jgi:uncharacterized protein YqeY
MSTGIIIAIVVVVIVVIALLAVRPAMKRKREERELEQRRGRAVEHHRGAAEERRVHAELAVQEESEAELIAGYLPAELGDDALDSLVAEAIADSGAATPADMGKVMGVLMPKVGGRADGKRVSAKVKEALS